MRIVNAALQSTIMVDFLRRGITDGSGSHSPHNELLRIAMEIIDGYLLCRAYQLAVVSVHQSTCDDEDMHNEIPYRLRWFMVQSSYLSAHLVFLGLFTKLLYKFLCI